MTTNTDTQDTPRQPPGRLQNTGDSNRLPCRGCTSNCKNRPNCNGKPWRME